MGRALTLQAVPSNLQQSANRRRTHVVPLRDQGCGQSGRALAGIPKRACWFASRHRINQPLQSFQQFGLLVTSTFTAATGATLPAWLKLRGRLKFTNPFANRPVRNTGRLGDRSDPASAKRASFSGSPAPPTSLVKVVDKVRVLRSNPVNNGCIWHRTTVYETAA